ncbi:MAG: 23S rRNA (pseudouridine(1915)-N(3))-methyltransferase RlmH [Methanoregula sp.]|uniref:23S rRNA (pseudouridine(1915)-N(3))-methyltransferase RlmH n=1 Tax=Methanoregula sp. TaxID=2052170 RepID=UPI0025EE1572|nr:23S rRNA (pseudouridine(1915)-N(3))-methyltransferase RlmH [Methanoregula sp.]MCK9632306.1 23S rRNA (pseudouridine(1915)-N(3))-methyltransferase RlmH [Methanoregula sp.]
MQIRIIAVGRIKEKFLQEGIAEYEKRLRPYAKVQVIEVPEEKRPASASPSVERVAMQKEGERILAVIPEGSFVVALAIQGEDWSSTALAEAISHWEMAGRNQVAFIIGGDLGLSPAVLARSSLRLSLSRMTFTHPMARLLLIEQIYRAFRILRGEPYHK